MSFFRNVMAGSLSLTDPTGWGAPWVGTTASGVPVSTETALKLSVVWACVRLLSETIAGLPLDVYRRLPNGGREEATTHPLYDLLHTQPNRYQTAIEFRQMMTAHALLRGNGLARIVGNERTVVAELIPIHPDHVQYEHMSDGSVRYKVDEPGKRPEVLLDDEVLHLKGMSFDGKVGVSVITYAREAMGLDLAAEAYGARFFGNGAEPRGVLQTPGKLGENAAKNLKESWQAAHSGANQHKVAVLEEGLTYQAVGLSNRDSQFLELRTFQAEDECRWFGVPPHMVGLTSKVTSWGSGIEQMGIGFVTYTLLPWLKRWEQAITRDLILAPQTYFVEHVVAGLLRGDQAARYAAYQIAHGIGVMSPNDIRRLENMNPREGGDEYASAAAPVAVAPPLRRPAPAEDADEEDDEDDEPDAHYRELVQASAARVVRKEVAALSKASKRDDFEAAAAVFFASHAEYVAEVMCVSLERIIGYVRRGHACLLENGLDNYNEWAALREAELVALVLEAR